MNLKQEIDTALKQFTDRVNQTSKTDFYIVPLTQQFINAAFKGSNKYNSFELVESLKRQYPIMVGSDQEVKDFASSHNAFITNRNNEFVLITTSRQKLTVVLQGIDKEFDTKNTKGLVLRPTPKVTSGNAFEDKFQVILNSTIKEINNNFTITTGVDVNALVSQFGFNSINVAVGVSVDSDFATKFNVNANKLKRQLDTKLQTLALSEVTKRMNEAKVSNDSEIRKLIADALSGKRPKPATNKKNSKSSSTTKTKQKTKEISVRLKPRYTGIKLVTSLLGLEKLIRAALNETVAKNMIRPHLEYQSGRFAGTVQLVALKPLSSQVIEAYYTYMKYPYQTFEPGFKQGFKGYDPRVLILKSIKEIAIKYVRNEIIGRRL